jgi:YbbR domain-containing protein
MTGGPPPSPGRGGWRRLLVSAVTENLALKASAVLLAIVLWFVVSAREPTEEVVGVRFAPVIDTSLVLRDPPTSIRALVLGRPSEILKLSTSPLQIRRPVASDVPDTLVLSLHASDVEVPDGVEVIVRDVEPHAVTLHFEATATRMVPVRSALRIAHAMGPTVVRLQPESVTIAGPRRVVSRIESVSTLPDTVSLDTLAHLVDIDTTRLGVMVRPPQVKAVFLRAPVRAPVRPPVRP